jgi:hypothetical protein
MLSSIRQMIYNPCFTNSTGFTAKAVKKKKAVKKFLQCGVPLPHEI